MEEKREEIYERIPWETIENPKTDRQTLIIGVAAAIVAGALVYSFVGNRPIDPPGGATTVSTIPEAVAPPTALAAPLPVPVVPPPAASQSISEADLYAIPPDRLSRLAAAHAEWFVLEYLTVDGAGENETLRMLLPASIPLPTAPAGTRVFVEWVGALAVAEVDVGMYEVEVLARYMVAGDGQTYERVDPEAFSVQVAVTESGPQVVTAPAAGPPPVAANSAAALGDLPPEIAALVLAAHPDSEIVGGAPNPEGSWGVVMLVNGPGGTIRPQMVDFMP